MTLNEYQERAMETCLPTADNFSYMMLNLVGEVGEFSSKVAKAIRKGYITINEGVLVNGDKCSELSENDFFYGLKAEIGDGLWQVAGLCKVMGWDLDDIAQMNLNKLKSRKERGKINGNGDNR